MMPDFIRKYAYRLFILISLGCLPLHLFASTQNWMKHACHFIEQGDLSKAERHLNYMMNNRKCSSLEKYEVHKLLQKIYLNQQRFPNYIKEIDKAEKIARSLHPIFMAEVYAHKAYYWHYMMWGDSAKVYSVKSMRIFQANRAAMAKIEIPFIFELHAISFLYTNDKVPPTSYLHLDIGEQKQKQFQWFDSALMYDQRFPYRFSIDRSRLYRSYANRWLDIVSSIARNELEYWSSEQNIQQIAFDKANKLYNQALKHLKPWHLNDYFALKGLIGLNYSVMGQHQRAAQLFQETLEAFSKADLLDRQKIAFSPLMVLMSFKVRNEMMIPYDSNLVKKDIDLLERLKPEFWKSFGTGTELPYDPYLISPYVNLFNLYTLRSLHEKQGKVHFSKAVSHLLTFKSYFHFLEARKTFQKENLPWFDVRKVQRKLKQDECYLILHNDNEFMKDKKILILRDTLLLIRSASTSKLSNQQLEGLRFTQFKQLSYGDYIMIFKEVMRILPKVKKVYISYDDKTPYEILIQNEGATSFSNARYLGQKINFVRLYNPFTYFISSSPEPTSNLDVRFLRQAGNSQLLFMKELFEKNQFSSNYSHRPYEGDLIELLGKTGNLHLYGHGELVTDMEAGTSNFELNYFISHKPFKQRQLPGDFAVNRNLVVLNNCFSGFPSFNRNEFNRTISLRMLSNGAKGIISSPDKVDDYFSAEFFKEFYVLIEDGVSYEDAFFLSRKHFFDSHPSMRHPSYWNALQFIQQTKLKNRVSNSNLTVIFWMLSFVVADVLLSLLYATWIKQSIRRH